MISFTLPDALTFSRPSWKVFPSKATPVELSSTTAARVSMPWGLMPVLRRPKVLFLTVTFLAQFITISDA